jgi:WD40 repeat protein
MWRCILIIIALGLAAWPAEPQQMEVSSRPTLATDMGGSVSGVHSIAASPDGKWFVTVANSGAIQIWSAADGSAYRTLQPSEVPTQATRPGHLAVASDASTLVVLADGKLVLVDVRTLEERLNLPVEPGTTLIAANPKQMVVATLDQQGSARVISLKDGRALFHTKVPGDSSESGDDNRVRFGFSPDGGLLTITTHDSFELWNWAKNQRLLTLDAHKTHSADLSRAVPPVDENGAIMNGVFVGGRAVFTGGPENESTAREQHYFWFVGATFSPDGRLLALCSRDELTILTLPTAHKSTFAKTAAAPVSGCFFVDGHQVLLPEAGQLDAELFSLDSGRIQSVSGVGSITDFVRVPGGQRSIMLTMDTPYLFDARSWVVKDALFSKVRAPSSVDFTPDGKALLWATWTRPLTQWSLDSGDAFEIPLGRMHVPVFSRNTRYAAETDAVNERVKIVNLAENHAETPLAVTLKSPTHSLSLSDDGSVIALSTDAGDVTIFSGAAHQSITRIPADHPSSVAVQPDGARIAIADRFGTTLYSVGAAPQKMTSIPRVPVPASTANLYGQLLGFSFDGKWLATLENGAVRLVSTETGQAKQVNEGNSTATCAAFSHDSQRLAFIKGPYSSGMTVINIKDGSVIFQDPTRLMGCPMAFSADGRILAASTADGVELISLTTGKVLASLYVFDDDKEVDWLVVTPDGLFDGTPAAWRQLKWRFSKNTFDLLPVEIFFRDFYRPGLLADIIAGDAPKAPAEIAAIDRRQPEVHLGVDADTSVPMAQRTIRLDLTVQESPRDARQTGSGARDLRLFRNGTLVQTWRGDLTLDRSGRATFSTSVPIVAGENHFTAYAFSRSDVKSADATLSVTGDDSLRRMGTAYVISMGVNHYAANTPARPLDLTYAQADANAFAQEFVKAQASLHQYAKIRIIPLMGGDATQGNLATVLNTLGGKTRGPLSERQATLLSGIPPVQPEDGVFLFYAGHGVARNGHFYLVPYDYEPNVPLSDPRSNTVSDLDLSRMLEGISPERSFLIIDACNSGQVVDTHVGPLNSSGLAQLAYEKGLYILAAS